ncbi:SCO7613 C-terminal domain-containing membrane protein [Kitasatospora sp. NPDC048365]|uniref:SCO7613 C-terminal domain-containing membrane protein n=1 Tax=Kitasatospora sp. NPDC048365 TaxID=3364050 RepID=UPI00371263F1
MTSPVPLCPDCRTALGPGAHTACPHCRLPLTGPDAGALWQIEVALGMVEQQRATLLAQREGLLARLRALRDRPAGAGAAAAWGGAPAAAGWAAGAGGPVGPVWTVGAGQQAGGGRAEVSGRSAQTVLLVLGGLLVSVAALVFTVVSWGYLGIGGRAAVLLALTAIALAVPKPLLRRGLTATAEAAAGIGLGLVLLDGYAARAAGLAGLDGGDGAAYWAVVTGVVAAGALGYGWALRLRFPLVVGFLTTRIPVLLALVAAEVVAVQAYAAAMVGATAVDVLLLGAARRTSRLVRPAPTAGASAETGTPTGDGPTGDGAGLPGAAAGAVAGAAAGSSNAASAGEAKTAAGGAPAGAGAAPWAAGTALPGGAAGAWPAGAFPAGPGGTWPTAGPAGPRTVRDGWSVLWQCVAGFAALWAMVGGLLAGAGSAAADGAGEAAWAVLPLGGLALLGLALAGQAAVPSSIRPLPAAAAGVALVVALGGVLRHLADTDWTAVAYEAPALLLLVAASSLRRTPVGVRRVGTALGLAGAGGGALLLTTLAAVPALLRAIAEPVAHADAAWAGATSLGWTWELGAAPLVGLALCAVAVVLADGLRPVGTEAAASAIGVVTVALLPVAAGAPYGVAVAVPLVLGVLATAATVLRGARPGVLAALCGAPAPALLWASADRSATVVVLGVCVLLAALLAWRGAAVAPVAGAAGVLLLGGEAAAVGTVGGLSTSGVVLAVLAVAVLSAPLAAVLRTEAAPAQADPAGSGRAAGALSLAVEFAGYALAVVALPLLLSHPGVLAFALAVSGVTALGVALRADRRVPAAVAAGVLLTCSSWVRLALWDVRTPEAYTLPLAVVALAIGHRRHRQEPDAASWSTYGPGLSLAFLPSVLALWSDGHWVRPLLLGVGALAVTVAGVRLRLQAPLLLGAATALLTAGHELAPTVVQALGLLPRWVPLALAGLLLLALGARYEQRLHDARRLRESLRTLR